MSNGAPTWQSEVLTRITDWVAPSDGAPPTAKELYLRAIDVAFRVYGELPAGTELRDALQAAKNNLPASVFLPLGSGSVPAQALSEYVRSLSSKMTQQIESKLLSPAALEKSNALIAAMHGALHEDLAKQFAADIQALQNAQAEALAQTKEAAAQAVNTAQATAREFERACEVATATIAELRESLLDYAQRMSVLGDERDRTMTQVATLNATLAEAQAKVHDLQADRGTFQAALTSARSNENDAKKHHLLELDARRQAEAKLAATSAKLTQLENDLSRARFDLSSSEKNHLAVLKDLTNRHENELAHFTNAADTARTTHRREMSLLEAARISETQRTQEQAQLISELRAELAAVRAAAAATQKTNKEARHAISE